MKKLFSLLFVALLAMSAWADTVVTVDFNDQGWDSNTLVTELTVDGVTLTFDVGTNPNSTKPTYFSNTSGGALRIYGGNTMTVAADQNLKKIDFTFASGEGSNDILSNVGNYNKAGKQWTIGSSDPSTSVVFTIDGTSGHRRIQELVITMEDAEPVTELVAPTFNPDGGEFTGSLEVTLTCPTENASIFWFYGTEEDQGVHNYYNGPIYLTETSTLTAYSTKGEEMSEYVTVTFTKVEQTVEAPVFTPAAGGFNDRIDVTLTCATPNAVIYYSLDNELWSQYVDPIPVTDDITIWAKAMVGDVVSEVVSATYTKNPSTTVEISFDASVDTGNSTGVREAYTVVKDPVTMYVSDGLVSTDHYRIYSGAEFNFTSAGAPIIKIELSSGENSNTPSNLSLPEGQSGTYTTIAHEGTWEGSAQEVSFKVNAQVRCYTIIVTLAGESGESTIDLLSEANALEDDAEFTFGGDAVVTVCWKGSVYLRDESGYGQIADFDGTFENGDVLSQGWNATKTSDNGWVKYIDATGVSASGETNAALAAAQKLTGALEQSMLNAYVYAENVHKGFMPIRTFTLNGQTITLTGTGDQPATGEYNIYGVIWKVGNELQLEPVKWVKYVAPPTFLRGDVDANKEVNISDVILLINYLSGLDVEIDELAADCSLDEQINITDAIMLINYLSNGTWPDE